MSLVAYGSSSEEELDVGKQSKRSIVNSAPAVEVDARHLKSRAGFALSRPVKASTSMIKHNLRAEAMWGDTAGPVNPFSAKKAAVEETAVDETAFDDQLYNRRSSSKRPRPKREKETIDESVLANSKGLWASVKYEDEDMAEPDDDAVGGVSEEQKQYQEDIERKREAAKKRRQEIKDNEAGDESAKPVCITDTEDLKNVTSSAFHGTEERDYQGRSWMEAPSSLRETDWSSTECFIPKKQMHCWKGHGKGVQSIKLFPKLGHLMLSGSLDGTCKIWGVYESSGGGNGRGEKRTYTGHQAPIRDVAFNADGSNFASGSYDKKMFIWDTETGKTLMSLTSGGESVPQCINYYPKDSNILVAGLSNSNIVQWDLRQGKIVQKYEHHLSGVNTVTIFDDGKRFLSTSDDKKILVWEFGIPVPTKYISDPTMQSIPVVRQHPTADFVACQSMDNRILTYELGTRVRQYKKQFKGHNNAGFACAIDFSPNGKYVMSGDSAGRLFFWDWKTCRKFREIKAHDQPCIGALWHPVEPSWVVTCAWDGLIKLWH